MADLNRTTIDWKDASKDWPKWILLRRVEELPNFPWKRETLRHKCGNTTGIPLFKKIKRRLGKKLIAFNRDELVDALQRYEDGGR